ncbi:PREDICTED: O-acyltransferase like protein-like [Branchiostoma belcheri]|uniref:O-acyltransferase like protein-like n=1 Tax=Branchiostoma belcheri TaxID=7741 RepID=A0A6P4ZUS3_BRABE|nr:PREDICTED: O-acyltransferase like protein-like [Branchiostoma belcheri]
MGREVGFFMLLSLACCSTSVAGQGFSASFYETWGYYTQLAQQKPIDWNTTMGLQDTGQVQKPCYDQSVQLHTDMQAGKSYAIGMLDSSGKFNPSGLFEGQWDDFGSFKGCRDRVKNAPDIPEELRPMYCVVQWDGIPPEMVKTTGVEVFTQGLCVPNTCSDSEVWLLAGTGLLGIKPMTSWTPRIVLCQREEQYASYGVGAIIAISIIAVILLVLMISTLYEFIITVGFSERRRKSVTSSKTGRFFLSFSVYSNTKKVFDTYQPPGQLPALHGIRVLSTLWIIYGHTGTFASVTITTNEREKRDFYSEWWAFIRLSMDKSVDTFLLLSALLVSYLFMKQLKKNDGSFTGKDLLLHYLHRYWRLTPVYAFLIMIFASLMNYMGTGPPWQSHSRGCETHVWTNLLYINNWFHGAQACFGWAWYLGVDMQLYILAPALLVLLYKKPKLGLVLIIVLLAGSMVASGLLQHFVVNGQGQDYFSTAYTATYARMGPYMVGLLLGYIFFKTDHKVPNTRRTKVLMLLGWVFASAIAVVFLQYVDGSPAWRTFDRTMFSCAVAWVVFACSVGYGGIITELLSWSGWVPLSRLTYTAYLVHPIIMYVHNMSLKTPLFYSVTNQWFLFIAYSFLAFLCGFVASIMVELPFFGLEKLIFPQRRGRDSSKAPNNAANEAQNNQALELVESGPVHDYSVHHKNIEISGPAAVVDSEAHSQSLPEQADEHWAITTRTNEEEFDHKL